MTKKMDSQNGMSLVEIMVGLAIMGVMTLGTATYMSQMQKSQYLVNAKNSVSVFQISLQNILNIPQICSQAFVPGTQAFNLAQTKQLAAPVGQSIQLRLPGGTTSITSGYREEHFTLSRLYLQSDPASTNISTSGPPSYLVKVIGDFDIMNPSNFASVLLTQRKTLGHLILQTNAGGMIESCRTSVSQFEQIEAVCDSIGGTFANGNCALPTPTPVAVAPTPSPDQQAQTLCTSIGGNYSNGNCALPNSGSVTSSSSSDTTVSPAQLQIICSSMGGTYANNRCTLATTTTNTTSTVSLPPTLKGCEAAAPACGTCKFAACTSGGWACTWDFRGSCMGYWEDSF